MVAQRVQVIYDMTLTNGHCIIFGVFKYIIQNERMFVLVVCFDSCNIVNAFCCVFFFLLLQSVYEYLLYICVTTKLVLIEPFSLLQYSVSSNSFVPGGLQQLHGVIHRFQTTMLLSVLVFVCVCRLEQLWSSSTIISIIYNVQKHLFLSKRLIVPGTTSASTSCSNIGKLQQQCNVANYL